MGCYKQLKLHPSYIPADNGLFLNTSFARKIGLFHQREKCFLEQWFQPIQTCFLSGRPTLPTLTGVTDWAREATETSSDRGNMKKGDASSVFFFFHFLLIPSFFMAFIQRTFKRKRRLLITTKSNNHFQHFPGCNSGSSNINKGGIFWSNTIQSLSRFQRFPKGAHYIRVACGSIKKPRCDTQMWKCRTAAKKSL